MKFSDIDFSALSRMMDSMSDEEKTNLNNMAQQMMNNMNKEPEPEVEDIDMYEFLGIDETNYSDIPGNVLDQIEAASDLEQYYEDIQDNDFSASVLFLSKAVLNMLRKYHCPIYTNALEIGNMANPSTTTIYSYLYPLMDENNIHKLVDEGFGNSNSWMEHKNFLQQIYILLNRAEYDWISYEDLQSLKTSLFEQNGLLNIKEFI